MNNQFDELTKSMAQSVTRRAALKKFGFGLVGMALAAFGLPHKAQAKQCGCVTSADCPTRQVCSPRGTCVPDWCGTLDSCCCKDCKTYLPHCDPFYGACKNTCPSVLGCS
jgi:hypothetical protein